MTKKLLIAISVITSITTFSQKKENTYPKAEFTLENGSKMSALFVAYTYPNGSYPSFFDKDDIYSFEYKTAPEAKTEKIGAKEVKAMKIYDENGDFVNGIERLDLKAINSNGELVDKRKRSFQPLLYDGKIQIFGSNMFMCQGNLKAACTYVYSMFYIRNSKDDFAIMPVDYDRINLFNFGSAEEKMIGAFRIVGKNCENFNQYLSFLEKKLEDKEFRKKFKEEYKKVRTDSFEEAKSSGKKGNFQNILGENMLRYYLNFYSGIVKEYEKSCSN